MPELGTQPETPLTPAQILSQLTRSSEITYGQDETISTVGGLPYSEAYQAFQQYAADLNHGQINTDLTKRNPDGSLAELRASPNLITLDVLSNGGRTSMGLPKTTGPDELVPMGARYTCKHPISETMANLPAAAFDTLPNSPDFAKGISWLASQLLSWKN